MDVVVTNNGDILALEALNFQVGNTALALFRSSSDGDLDDTFGTSGYFQSDEPDVYLWPAGVHELSDGKILIAATGTAGNTGRFVLIRLTADGHYDTSFGTGGTVEHQLGFGPLVYTSILQPDGKLLMTGRCATGMYTCRFRVDGSFDPTFGTNGVVSVNPSGASFGPRHIVLDANGNIYLGGSKLAGFDASGWVLGKLDTYGQPVGSFGTNGFVVFDHIPDAQGTMYNNYESIERLYVDASGSIYAAGAVALVPVKERMALAKFDATGALDPTFGTNGSIYATPNANERAWVDDLVVDPMGTLVLSGHNQSFVEMPHLLLLRTDMAGTIIGGTEHGGILLYNDPAGVVQSVSKIALDHTGRIILASGYYNQPIGKAALTAFSHENSTAIAQAATSSVEDLFVYPNPASSEISVTYDLLRSGTIRLDLMDATGRVVEHLGTRNSVTAGRYVERFALSRSLASGHYRLVLTTIAGRSSVNIELIR